jgi:hypothetical protein
LAEPSRTVPGKGKVPFDPVWFWRQFRQVPAPDYAEDLGPCRIWRDYPVDSNHYPGVSVDGKRWIMHRLSWWLTEGSLPQEPFFVLHHCDRRACGAPAHLYEGTKKDNKADEMEHGRWKGPGWDIRLRQYREHGVA